MNKNTVDEMLPRAYEVLKTVGIANNGVVNKAFRSQISSFGAAVLSGGTLASIAFFSQTGGSEVERERLMKGIHLLLQQEEKCPKNLSLFDYAAKNGVTAKDEILTASVALKLAMNLFVLESKKS